MINRLLTQLTGPDLNIGYLMLEVTVCVVAVAVIMLALAVAGPIVYSALDKEPIDIDPGEDPPVVQPPVDARPRRTAHGTIERVRRRRTVVPIAEGRR